MKTYPTIAHWHQGLQGEPMYAFDKLDGSNIRAEWSKKRGWYKFGSRKVLLHSDQKPLCEAIDIFKNKYGEDLARIFTDDKDLKKSLKFVVFFEFFGEKTFAGWHDDDDTYDVVLFDVNQDRKGIIPPKEFLKKFGHLHIPELVYEGNYNQKFIDVVQHNRFENYDFEEGVVCKGTRLTKRKNQSNIWMCKVKTFNWLNKVKEKLGQKAYEEEI